MKISCPASTFCSSSSISLAPMLDRTLYNRVSLEHLCQKLPVLGQVEDGGKSSILAREAASYRTSSWLRNCFLASFFSLELSARIRTHRLLLQNLNAAFFSQFFSNSDR
jgi:hypothetical protein